MSGSFALRRLLFADNEEGEYYHRGYHYRSAYEPLMLSTWIERPAQIPPTSRYNFSIACLLTTLSACSLMKKRNKEKWWFGLFMLTGIYYCGVKAHKVDNGLVGHQCGFFAAGLGTIGSTARLVLRSGPKKQNLSLLATFSTLMWYELGRFHFWSEHVIELRRLVTPQRSYNLLSDYIDPSCPVEFLPYRVLQ